MKSKPKERQVAGDSGPRGAVAQAFFLAACAFTLVTCVSQDPLAPEGSTVKVSANPQSVVSTAGNPGCTTLTATLRGKDGVRLPDQEVTFSTTAGRLCFVDKQCPPQNPGNDCPPPETGLVTDDDGQASMHLETNQSATVTAQSGSVSGTTTVNVISGNLSNISITATPQVMGDCAESVDLEVTADDPNGTGVSGLRITFLKESLSGTTQMMVNISPANPLTDGTGFATATLTMDSNFCNSKCTASDPNAPFGGACGLGLRATDPSGSVISNLEQISESIQ